MWQNYFVLWNIVSTSRNGSDFFVIELNFENFFWKKSTKAEAYLLYFVYFDGLQSYFD